MRYWIKIPFVRIYITNVRGLRQWQFFNYNVTIFPTTQYYWPRVRLWYCNDETDENRIVWEMKDRQRKSGWYDTYNYKPRKPRKHDVKGNIND